MEEEAEIDDQYTKGLINGVIDCISESSHKDSSSDIKRRPRKKREKGKDVPDFELTDIVGDFEIDDAGNYIILRGERGELLDRKERPVNKRGYIVDKLGNIINTKHEIIFKATDLDSDDEIPAPYGFEKRKQNLLSMTEEQQFQVNDYGNGPGKQQKNENDSENDEDIVEKQFRRLKQGQQMSSDSGSRSQIGEPLAGDRNFMIDENGNIDDMVDIITKKTVPVKKENLKQTAGASSPRQGSAKKGKKKFNNPPPKRFRPEDQLYFQGRSGEDVQQKKLSKIAESIGGFAAQVTDNMADTSGNKDLHGIRGTSQKEYIDDADPQGNRLEAYKQRHQGDVSSIKRGQQAPGTTDFYVPGLPSQDQNQSLLSQDFVYLNDNLAPRPGAKAGKKSQKDLKGQPDGNQLRKVYGNINDISGFEQKKKRTNLSPNQSSSGIRPESS